MMDKRTALGTFGVTKSLETKGFDLTDYAVSVGLQVREEKRREPGRHAQLFNVVM